MPNAGNVPARPGSKTVAIVVPLYNREELTPDEEISLRHLKHSLGHYDAYMLAPEGLRVNHPGFVVKRLDASFFGSVEANKRLMLSRTFYEAFVHYKYILLYQLDALVFSDRLEQWCDTDVDYIGAPWLQCEDSPRVTVPRVGNGGFSLRKVESFLKVFDSPEYGMQPEHYWDKYFGSSPKHVQLVNLPRRYLKRLKAFNNVRREMSRYGHGEDRFWSDEAVKYHSGFKVAPFEMGLRFAFDVAPRLCFELNNRTLPFGCHAWPRYDKGFWEPFLLK